MKRHECPTCRQDYECTRTDCASPLVYDCFFCYVSRYAVDLERSSREIAVRFGFSATAVPPALSCYAD